jgi:hypothetical protein
LLFQKKPEKENGSRHKSSNKTLRQIRQSYMKEHKENLNLLPENLF